MANLILEEPEETEILDLGPYSNKPIHTGAVAKNRATLYDISFEETPGAVALQQEIESGNEDTLRDKLVAQEHRKRNTAAKTLVEDNIPFLDIEGLSYLAKTEAPNKNTILEETFVKKANDLVQTYDDSDILAAHRDENPMGFIKETAPFEEMATKSQIIFRMQEDLEQKAKEQGWAPYIDDTIESFLTLPSWSNLTRKTESWSRGGAMFELVDRLKALPPGEMQIQTEAIVDELAAVNMLDAQKFLAAMSVTGYSPLDGMIDNAFDIGSVATSAAAGITVKGTGRIVKGISASAAKERAGAQRIAEAVEAGRTAPPPSTANATAPVDRSEEISRVAKELEDFHKYFSDEKAESKASFDKYFKPNTKDSAQVTLHKISERARVLSEELKTLDPKDVKRQGDIAEEIAGLREAHKRFTVLNSKESFKQYFGDDSQSSFDEFFGSPPAKRTSVEYLEEAKRIVEEKYRELSPSANLAKNVNSAISVPHVTPEDVLNSAGNVAEASSLKANEELALKMFPQAPSAVQRNVSDLFNQVPSLTNPKVVVTGAENLSNLRTKALIEEGERVQRLFNQAVAGTARVIRTPEEQLEQMITLGTKAFEDRYKSTHDAMLDVRVVPAEATGLNVNMLEVSVGTVNKELWNKKEYAQKAAKAYGFSKDQYKIDQVGSKYVIKAYYNLDETGKDVLDHTLSPDNKPKVTSWNAFKSLWKYPLSSKLQASEFQSKQRANVAAGQSTLGYLLRETLKPLEDLSNREFDDLNSIMEINRITPRIPGDLDTRGMFYKNSKELTDAYVRHKGRLPTDKEEQAYFATVRSSDIDWFFRVIDQFKNKAARGAENVTVSRLGPNDTTVFNTFEGRARPDFNFDMTDYVDLLVIDPEGIVTRKEMRSLSPEDRTRYKDWVTTKGYRVIQADDARDANVMKIAGEDKPTPYILSRDASFAPLRMDNQVNYRPGFHNEYKAPYYVKQSRVKYGRFEGDTTALAASSEAKAIEDSKLMEKGRVLLKEGKLAELDTFLRTNLPHTLEDFKKLFDPEKGHLDVNVPFVVVKRGERSAKAGTKLADGRYFSDVYPDLNDDLDKFHNPSATFGDPFTAKRDPLVHEIRRGTEDAPLHELGTADQFSPLHVQVAAMGKLIKSTLYDDYQMTSASNYIETFAGELEMNGKTLSREQLRRNPLYYLKNATIPKTNMRRYLQAKMLKNSIENLVGTPSAYANALDTFKQGLLSTVHKRLGEKYVRMVPEKMLPMVNDPLVFFRNVAFHTKLGLFNPVQLFVQGSSVINAGLISPVHAPMSFPATSIMWGLKLTENPDIIKSAAKKVAHFPGWTEAKFVESKKFMDEIAFDRIGGEYSFKSDAGDPPLIRSKTGQLMLDKGPVFFNMGERAVRMTGWNTAYLEYAAKNPNKVGKMTRRDAQAIHERAQVFTANMTRDSNSFWQTGLAGNFTQFWSYNVRMVELMLGHQLTAGEKARLIGGHAFLWGTAPTAGVAYALQEGDLGALEASMNPFDSDDLRLYAMRNGIDIDDGLLGALYNGMVSSTFAGLTGEEMNFGARFGMSPIKVGETIERNFKEHEWYTGIILTALGPSGSIAADIIKESSPVFSDMYDLATGEGKAGRIIARDIANAFREISGFNVGMRSLYATLGWQWVSQNGNPMSDPEKGEASLEIFKALTGTQSNKESMVFDMLNNIKSMDEADKALSKRIKILLTDYHSSKKAGNDEAADVYYTEVAALLAGSGWSQQKKVSVIYGSGGDTLMENIFDDFKKKQKDPQEMKNVEGVLMDKREE